MDDSSCSSMEDGVEMCTTDMTDVVVAARDITGLTITPLPEIPSKYMTPTISRFEDDNRNGPEWEEDCKNLFREYAFDREATPPRTSLSRAENANFHDDQQVGTLCGYDGEFSRLYPDQPGVLAGPCRNSQRCRNFASARPRAEGGDLSINCTNWLLQWDTDSELNRMREKRGINLRWDAERNGEDIINGMCIPYTGEAEATTTCNASMACEYWRWKNGQ